MNTEKDYYAVLGVLSTAEDVVISGAYRGLAHRYHPDRFDGDQGDANARMAEINEAYRVLSDGDLRSQYDKAREHRAQSGRDARSTAGDMSFEFEMFRPFAEKLREFGFDESTIRGVLAGRGVQPSVAERLARSVSEN